MSRIIALIDGSVYSQSVCDHAAWLATRTGASVEITHVLGRRETSSAPANLSGNITLGARTALLQELSALDEQRARLSQKRGRALLDDARERVEKAGVTEVTTRLRHGDIVDEVTDTDAEMIVVGKRGEAADFASLHLGSNLERVVRSSRRPVLVASRAFRPIGKVLIAYDGGTSSLKAVDHIARSSAYAGLTHVLLMVGPETTERKRQIEGALALLRAAGRDASAEIRPGQPDAVIAQAVESEGFDMVLMGAYGHSRIRSLIIGSTTAEMVRSCKVPVVLFR